MTRTGIAPPQHPRPVPLDAEKANAATFLLYALAFNLMNIARNLLAQPDFRSLNRFSGIFGVSRKARP